MTTRPPRLKVIATPTVERALRVAGEVWPGARRSELVDRLFATAAVALEARQDDAERARIDAVDRSAGAFDLAYEPDHLGRLRTEWPH